MISKDQIKTHYEKHKTVYHIIGTGLVIFTTVIITRRIVRRNDDILRTCIRPMSDTDVHTTKSQNNTASSLFGQREGVDYNLILNSGTFASQTIEHIHIHYIPRYKGDDLYLPWTNQER